MDNLNLPDTVIGLGGSGKRLVFETLTQQSGDGKYWLLDEMMSERNRALNRINFFTIDSATVEAPEDRSVAQEIDDAINDIEDRNRGNGVNQYTNVNHEYVNIGNDIRDVYQDRDSFIFQNHVEDRLSNTDLTHWWLQKEDLRSGLDFNEGVYRRRARSKGMYYAAKQGGDKISRVVSAARDEVALVTALGGGTGSGMFVDLAREINEDGVSVTLFAVMSNGEEAAEQQANTHAALSELEYLQLTDQNPFSQIVLLPFEPASEKDEPRAHGDEFMDAFPYTLLSFYNLASNIRHTSLACDNAGYHPFTVAAPQVIRYNTAHLEQARSDITEFLDEKGDLLDTEMALYEAIESFLVENYDAVRKFVAEIEDEVTPVPEESMVGPRGQNILQRRLNDIHTLATLDTFDQLNCESPETYQSALSQAESADGTVVDTIRDLHRKYQLQPEEDISGTLDIDLTLDDILDREIEAIVKKARVLELSERVDETEVRDNLVRALNKPPDQQNTAKGHDQLDTLRKEAKQEQGRLEDELEATEAAIEEAGGEIDSAVERAERRLSGTLDQLQTIWEHEDDLVSAASEVDDELSRIRRQINNETDPEDVERITFTHDMSAFDDLEEMGIEDLPDISRAVGYVTSARAEALRQDNSGSGIDATVDKVKSWINGQDSEHQDRYEGYVTSLRQQSTEEFGQLATLPRWEQRNDNVRFEIDLEEAVADRISDREVELLGTVADEYVQLVDELQENEDLDEEIRDSFTDVSPSLGAVRSLYESDVDLMDGIADTLRDAVIGEHQSRRDELTQRVEAKGQAVERYRKAFEFYIEHNDLTGYAATEDDLRNELNNIGIDEDRGRSKDDFQYIKREDPHGVDQLLEVEDLRSEEFWRKERSEIRDLIQHDVVGRNLCQTSEYFRLGSVGGDLTPPSDSNTKRAGYSEHTAFPVFMSRLFEEDRDISFDARSELRGGYGFGLRSAQKPYAETFVQNGGPWDIAVTMFIGGVFLDNLKEMQEGTFPNGYEYQETNGTDPIRLHHSWGLGGEDRSGAGSSRSGIYARRSGIMNLKATQDDDPSVTLDRVPIEFLNDASDEEIQAAILENLFDVQEFTVEHGYNAPEADD